MERSSSRQYTYSVEISILLRGYPCNPKIKQLFLAKQQLLQSQVSSSMCIVYHAV